jgi:hypothetical protein
LLEATELKSKAGATFKKLEDGSYLAEGKNGDSDVYTFTTPIHVQGFRALRLEALSHPSMAKRGPGRADNGNIGLSRIRVFASPLNGPPRGAEPLRGGETNEVKLTRARATVEKNSNTLSIASALDDNPKTGWAVDPKFGTNHAAIFESWMTDTDQGAGHLLARVIVNRLWQHHLGQGLVATPNDFGVQGAKPTHPGLLDWLAAELIRGGWRLKPIHRLIMTSGVYQQNSNTDAAGLNADPANALLSRRTTQRLEGEAIRDSLLFVSGVLDTNMFGPGTLDQASRRRSIYFTVKRSQLVPAMQSFDAPEPLVSQGTRLTTTVAPQALFLMNSPHVRSWAGAFAKRIAPNSEAPLAGAVARAYSFALNRLPTKSERADAIAFIEQQTTRYVAEGRPDARDLALTDFAQVVFGLNEFIYVE